MIYKKYLELWLEYYVKPVTKEKTYNGYRQQVEKYIIPILGKYDLHQLTAERLQGFVSSLMKMELSSNTISGIISRLKTSLKTAKLVGKITLDLATVIVRPRIKERKIECFTKKEQQKIEEYILLSGTTRMLGVIICLYTGVRLGELLSLKWDDINLPKGIISISKTCRDSWENGEYVKIIDTPKTESSKRIIPIPKQLKGVFKKLSNQKCGEYVICGRSQYGAEVRTYQRSFSVLLDRLSIEHKGFHSLRHTFATRAVECGMDIKTLSEILGHKNPSITLKRYTHSMLEHKKQMMNRVGNLFCI